MVKYIVDNAFKKGSRVHEHLHSCYEIILISNSSAKVNFQSLPIADKRDEEFVFDLAFNNSTESVLLSKDQFIIMPPHILHDEIHLDDQEIIAIGFESDSKGNSLNKFTLKKHDGNQNGIAQTIRDIAKEFKEKKYQYEEMINAMLSYLLVRLYRSEITENKNKSINFVVSYLNQNVSSPLKIENLADMSGYSLSRFRTLFTLETGLSPKQYILNAKLKHAIYLLKNSRVSLVEISDGCGFSTYYQFSAFLKKKTKKSPSDIRKESKKFDNSKQEAINLN